MVVIEFSGGLGNQMFLYGLYHSFYKKGVNVKVELSHFEKGKNHNGFELEKVFSLSLKRSFSIQRFFIKKITKLLFFFIQASI